MIKLLIADDEQVERIALQQIIERGLPEIEVVGQAQNGRTAIELAEKLEPDLILMDISMPGIDGLEAVQQISNKQPTVKFIMVTAYDEFDYARQAIKLGVSDYLLKPTKPADIVKTVSAVVHTIMEERYEQQKRESDKNQLAKLLPVAEADLVMQLLFDHVHEIHLEEILPLPEGEAVYYVMVLSLISKSDGGGIGRQEEGRRYRVLKQVIHDNASAHVGAMTARQIPVVLIHKGPISVRAHASILVRKLLNAMHADLHMGLFIGIGSPVTHLDAIRQSYHEALLASADLALPVKHCFYEEYQKTSASEMIQDHNVEKQMLEAVRSGQRSEAQAHVEIILDLYEHHGRPLLEAQQRLLDLLLIVWRLVQEMGGESEKPYYPSHPTSYAQLRSSTLFLLDRMLASMDHLKQAVDPDLFTTLKSYIKSHAHSNISLEMIAQHVQLSPFYVSKLFKDQFGMNYIDFLTECRIEKAKELMLDKSKSLKEISFEVGYNNPNYFSRVFKKVCGTAPTEYRVRLLGQS